MKFAGGVFTTICAVTGIVAGVGVVRYAQPAPLAGIQIVSGNTSFYAHLQAQNIVDRHNGVSFKTYHIVDLVTELIPALEKVTVRKKDGSYYVSVVQQKPIGLINQEYVLTERGYLVHKNQFDQRTLDQLFAYTTVGQLTPFGNHPEHVSFIHSFDTDLLTAYSVVWVNASRVELLDKQDAKLRIVVSADVNLPLDFDKTYQELKKEIKSLPAKKGRTWQVDMRFKNQILVC